MSQNISQLFDEIESFIARHRSLLSREQEEEMAALAPLGARLAQAALMLSENERAAYSLRLEEVIGQLEELSRMLSAKREEVAGELQMLSNVVKRANSAYRAAASGPPDEEEE